MVKVVGAAGWATALLLALGAAGAGEKKARPKLDPDKLFLKLDANGDGRLSREEFMRLAEKIRERLGEETGARVERELGRAFDRFDAEKKGLTLEQFRDLLREEARLLRKVLSKKQDRPAGAR